MLLRQLGFVEPDSFRLTDQGRSLAKLPLHPRLSALLHSGAIRGRLEDAALLAALVSEKDVLRRDDRPARTVASSDLLLRADAVMAFEYDRSAGFELLRSAAQNVLKVKGRLVQMGRAFAKADVADEDDERARLRMILADSRTEWAAGWTTIDTPWSAGTSGRLARESSVREAELLVAVGVDAGRRGAAGVSFVSPARSTKRGSAPIHPESRRSSALGGTASAKRQKRRRRFATTTWCCVGVQPRVPIRRRSATA